MNVSSLISCIPNWTRIEILKPRPKIFCNLCQWGHTILWSTFLSTFIVYYRHLLTKIPRLFYKSGIEITSRRDRHPWAFLPIWRKKCQPSIQTGVYHGKNKNCNLHIYIFELKKDWWTRWYIFFIMNIFISDILKNLIRFFAPLY